MYLVKDLQNHRIVYYWTNEPSAQPISPAFASLALASEWRLFYLNGLYEGTERRGSPLDRRRLAHKRELQQNRSNLSPLFPKGRRQADRVVDIDIDLARDKLADLFALHAPEEIKKRALRRHTEH